MRGNWSAKLIKQFAYITDWEGFWPGTSAALCAVRIWLFFHWSGTSDEDRKHGKDGAVVERRPRPPCRMGKDACNQHSFPKTMLQIFQCWFLQFYQIPAFGQWPWNKRYFPENVSGGINKQFFRMKNAWCGSISSRFSVMLSRILVLASSCKEAAFSCIRYPTHCQCLGSEIGIEGKDCRKNSLMWCFLLFWRLIMSSLHLEILVSKPIEDKSFLILTTFLSTDCGSPPMQLSSI